MKKTSILIALLLVLTQVLFSAGSFTYTGPSIVDVNYNQTSATATFYFTFNVTGLFQPTLVVDVDGTVVSVDLCNSGQYGHTPSSYSVLLAPGVHTVKFSLLSVNDQTLDCYDSIIHQVETTSVTARIKVKVDNYFGGGSIYVDNNTISKSAPYYRSSISGNSFLIGAIEQSFGGYQQIWNANGTNNSNWTHDNGSGIVPYTGSQTTTYNVSNWYTGTSIIANLRKVCNLTFTNSFSGINETFYIKINGSSVSAPTAQYQVVDQNSILLESTNRLYNNVFYKFSHWSDDANAPQSRTLIVSMHYDITAYFDAINPPSAPQNLSVTENNNEHPFLSWTASSEPEVNSYNIYRQKNSDCWNLIGSDTSTSYEDLGVTTTYRHGDDIYYKITALNIHD